MDSREYISIVIPCYNCEEWIENLYNSLNNQTDKSFEVIFVNDGSKDNSLKKFEEVFSVGALNCKIINQENRGVSVARNVGIDNAMGKYIYFLDPDDKIEKNFCEDILYNMANSDIDMIFFNYRLIEGGHIKDIHFDNSIHNKVKGSKEILIDLLSDKFSIHMCSFVVRRELLENKKLRFVEGAKYGEDHEFILKCISESKKITTIKDIYFNYCIRNLSATQTFSLARLDSIYSAERTYEYVTNKFDDIRLKKLMSRYVAKKTIYNLRTYNKLKKSLSIDDTNKIESALFKEIKKNKHHIKYLDFDKNFNIADKFRKVSIIISPKLFVKINDMVTELKNSKCKEDD